MPTRRTTFIFVTLLKYFSNTLFNCFYDGLESHEEFILQKKVVKQHKLTQIKACQRRGELMKERLLAIFYMGWAGQLNEKKVVARENGK